MSSTSDEEAVLRVLERYAAARERPDILGLRDHEADEAWADVEALGLSALSALDRIATEDPRKEVAGIAAHRATKLREQREIESHRARVDAAPDSRGRELAIAWLESETEAGRAHVQKRIADEKDPRVRIDTLLALLVERGRWSEVAESYGRGHGAVFVCVSALVARHPDPEPFLREVLQMPTPVAAEAAMAMLLTALDGKRTEAVVAIHRDARVSVRRAALIELGEVEGKDDPARADAAALVLADPDPIARWTAVSILGRHGRPELLPRLVELLDDPHPWVRIPAADAYRSMAKRAGIPLDEALATLRAHADDPEPSVRSAILYAIIELRDAPRPAGAPRPEPSDLREAFVLAMERLALEPAHERGARHSLVLEEAVLAGRAMLGAGTDRDRDELVEGLRHRHARLAARHFRWWMNNPRSKQNALRVLADPDSDGAWKEAVLEACIGVPEILLQTLRTQRDVQLRLVAIQLFAEAATAATIGGLRTATVDALTGPVREAADAAERAFLERRAVYAAE